MQGAPERGLRLTFFVHPVVAALTWIDAVTPAPFASFAERARSARHPASPTQA